MRLICITPSKEETKFAKWEDYLVLVAKVRRQVATLADLDGAEDISLDDDTHADGIDVRDEHSDNLQACRVICIL